MRESRKIIFNYAAMIGVPVLMIASVLAYLYSNILAQNTLTLLIAIGLFVYGVFGFREVYAHRFKLNGKLRLVDRYKFFQETNVKRHKGEKNIQVHINRFNPSTKRLEGNIYNVKVDKYATALDALITIKDRIDPTLSLRYSCRMGICGSCGMDVNGKPVLACETNVFENTVDGKIGVSPMLGHPLLKDLVTDADDFFMKHISVKPYLYRKDQREHYEAKHEYRETVQQEDKFLPYSYCIMCGLCLDACPVVNSNPKFVGPQALSQAYRYYADSRDQMDGKRLSLIDSLSGVWGCEFAGSCSKACPKGVDPATAIQLLKGELTKNVLKPDNRE